jgi:hypothetical protein
MLYSYPRLSDINFLGMVRLGGPGLGNLLLPWARSIVASKKYNLRQVSPTWPQIKAGPILRREKDFRTYHDFFSLSSDQVKGFRKMYLLSSLKKIPESNLCKIDFSNVNSYLEDAIVVFQGMDINKPFDGLLMHHTLIADELFSMTKRKHKKGLDFDFRNSISVHVRFGDFSSVKNSQSLSDGRRNSRIPISWYIHKIQIIRQSLDLKIPVYIFSDGQDNEMLELLNLPNVQRITFGSSIADLIALSRSKILIASGSTFSMWASYLGRMPVIWHKGQLRQRLYCDGNTVEVECSESEELPNYILNEILNQAY